LALMRREPWTIKVISSGNWNRLLRASIREKLTMTNEKAKVVIAHGGEATLKEKDVDALVREALAGLGDLSDLIGPGKKVLIKPNVADPTAIRGEVTDVRVVRALAKYVLEKGAHPIIAESTAVGMNTEQMFDICGYLPLREEGLELVDLDTTETVKVPVDNPTDTIKQLEVYKLPLEVDTVISAPIMKTHPQLRVTLAMKNLKGCLPDSEKKKFHLKYGVDEAVAHLVSVVRPQLSVVDGIWAGAGLMTEGRILEEMNVVVASRSPLAADTVSTRLMGFDPKDIPHLVYARDLGLGSIEDNDIEVVGKPVGTLARRFVRADEVYAENEKELGVRLVSSKTCTGCNSGIHTAVAILKAMGEESILSELTIAAGRDCEIPDIPKDQLVLVGNCIAKHKDKGRSVEGCPVISFDLAREISDQEVPQYEDYLHDKTYDFYAGFKEAGVALINWDEPPDEAEMRIYVKA